MKSSLAFWTLLTVFQRRHLIDPQPGYQRGAVWDVSKRQLLIDSILRGYDIPKLYLRSVNKRPPFEFEVVDGQQRLRAIWNFLDDEFPVADFEGASDLPADVVGKVFSKLPPPYRDQIGLFPLAITVLEADTPQVEVQELFLRLQEGLSLNAAEKRNAMIGPVREFVYDLGENHSLFPLLGMTAKRYQWHELAAIALLLERADGPTDLRGAPLRTMYLDDSFDPLGSVALSVRNILEYLAAVARQDPGSMRTRWGFVDLYLAIRQLFLDGESVGGIEKDVLDHHLLFEDERLQAAGALEEALAAADDDYALRDIDRYVLAFKREGATQENVARRHEVYLSRLRQYLSDRRASDLPITEP